MLQRAASNAYTWWWASHIRTKQSKWLDNDIEEMEERVKCMLKIIEQDGDSFARKAEMYFKKRPELVNFVEETYKAYRALAEKYDHISRELHKANHTIATAFPDQIHFDTQDEDDDNLPETITSIDPSKLRKPSANLSQVNSMKRRKESQPTLKKSRIARANSKGSKEKAQEEIDSIQKGILVLQTEKEFIKISYEEGMAKYWEIEEQINEMQEEVFFLQDGFSANVVIEDDEARTIMAVTALKSCEATLNSLQEQQKRFNKEAKLESERIKIAKEKLVGCKGEDGQFDNNEVVLDDTREVNNAARTMDEEVSSPMQENLEIPYSSCAIITEHVEVSSNTTVVELAEKINELVSKVISLEVTSSSQTAQIKSMRMETDALYKNLQSFEDEKKALIDDLNNLRERLKKAEELLRPHNLDRCVQDKQKLVDGSVVEASLGNGDILDKPMSPKLQDHVNIFGSFQDFDTSQPNFETTIDCDKRKVETKEAVCQKICGQDDGSIVGNDISATENVLCDISEKLVSPKHQNHSTSFDIFDNVPSINSSERPKYSENAEVIEIPNITKISVADESQRVKGQECFFNDISATENALCDISEKLVSPINQNHSTSFVIFDNVPSLNSSERPKYSKNAKVMEIPNITKNSVAGESQRVEEQECFFSDKKVFNHIEEDHQLKDDLVPQDHKQEDAISVPLSDDTIHPSNKDETQFGEQEVSVDWLHSLVNGIEGKEKAILVEYTSILRNYKETKKRLSEAERKNQEYLQETKEQLKKLESANVTKDEAIQSLQKTLKYLESNINENANLHLLQPEEVSALRRTKGQNGAKARRVSFDVSYGIPPVGKDKQQLGSYGQQATSVVEEKFRRDIDTLLEENLEFWLRFSTTFQNIRKFQTDFEDLQAEIEKERGHKSEEGRSNSSSEKKSKPKSLVIEKQLKELKTELQVWLEQNKLMQGELQTKFSSLGSLQEEISGALELSLQEDRLQFAPYQAAKFHGELLNIQMENNKVSDELQAGMDHVSGLQAEVEKTLSMLHEKFELPESTRSNNQNLRHVPTKNRVPLGSFLFTGKPKKQPWIFRMNPGMRKHAHD